MSAGSRRTEGRRAMSVSEWTGIAQAAISLLMVGVVWVGIVLMRRAGDQRAMRDDQHHAEFMAAHKETMAAYEKTREETMAAQEKTHRETMAAHENTMAAHKETMAAHRASHAEAMRALEALIERTGG